ncbi:MAG TPA: DNA polymerase III subunit delta' [Candidatus Ozemobacteraceae bacterium]|nr:DNA polymerase III subunit delta' [Candidatus Ozemobacteraceae bacterium]
MTRPAVTFRSVLLQDAAVGHLRRSLARNRVAQTYLFTGSPSVGKGLTALAFAATLQCLESGVTDQNALPEACGGCLSCRRIAAGSHPDVTTVTVQGNDIRIDQVRRLQELAVLQPNMGRWRIFIIDPADRLNDYSANSLLKILEEAPPRAIFILLAESPERVLPTVRSRSEQVVFRTPSHEEARRALADASGKPAAQAARCYALAGGAFGTAWRLLEAGVPEAAGVMGLRAAHVAYLEALLAGGAATRARLEAAPSLEAALQELEAARSRVDPGLAAALHAFTRGLVVGVGLPAAFPILFTRLFLEAVESVRKDLKKEVDALIAKQKQAYSPGLLKEIEDQCGAAVSGWAGRQPASLLESLLRWYEDAYHHGFIEDDACLLNLDRKDDIMAVTAARGPAFIHARLQLLHHGLELLRRFVQPALVLEHVLTDIGGPST